jgi:DNA-binding CsgD family transcriptional regulator
MADRGKKIDEGTQKQIKRLSASNNPTDVARMANVSRPTVYKYKKS